MASPRIAGRERIALAAVALLPGASGLVMLDPDRGIILGLASLTYLAVPLCLLALPGAGGVVLPRGRLGRLALLVLVYALILAVGRAVYPGFSLTALSCWVGAAVAGLALHAALRARGTG
ncbi:hypothetical protein, partial [Roseobacter sp. HKCCA0434]|uniref:hypothetical protein n=1 Tax=Roseobacter sp. HKCCA0434 TaxID=3079297 RepID=UPI002905A51F